MARSSPVGKRAGASLGAETARHGLIYTGGQVLSSLVTLAMLVYVARALQPGDFGIYAIVVAFYTVLGIGGNFGMGTAMRKRLPEARGRAAVSELLTNGYAVSTGAALLVAAAAYALSGYIAAGVYGMPRITVLLQAAALMSFFAVLFNVTLAMLVGMGRVWEAGVSNIVYSGMQLVGVVAFVTAGFGVKGAVAGLAAGLVIGTAAELVYLFRSVDYTYTRPTMGGMRALMEFSMPIVASNIMTQGVANFSVLLLGAFAAPAAVGNYNAAFKVGRFVEIVFASNSFVLLPAFSRAIAAGRQKGRARVSGLYNSSITFTLLLLLPVIVYLASVSAPLMKLLFSASYGPAQLYFGLIAVGAAAGIIWNYAGTLMIGHGSTREFMKYEAFGVALQMTLLLALVPAFGAIGAVAALFIVSPIVLDYAYARALRTQFGIAHDYGRILRIWGAALALLGVLALIARALGGGYAALAANAMAAALLYLPLAALFGAVDEPALASLERFGAGHGFGRQARIVTGYARWCLSRLHRSNS